MVLRAISQWGSSLVSTTVNAWPKSDTSAASRKSTTRAWWSRPHDHSGSRDIAITGIDLYKRQVSDKPIAPVELWLNNPAALRRHEPPLSVNRCRGDTTVQDRECIK